MVVEVIHITAPSLHPPLKSAFDSVPKTGWATETTQLQVSLLNAAGPVLSINLPSAPEDSQVADDYYRNAPKKKFDRGYRPESRYVRLLCVDMTGDEPKVFKVPQYSSTPPALTVSCTSDEPLKPVPPAQFDPPFF